MLLSNVVHHTELSFFLSLCSAGSVYVYYAYFVDCLCNALMLLLMLVLSTIAATDENVPFGQLSRIFRNVINMQSPGQIKYGNK